MGCGYSRGSSSYSSSSSDDTTGLLFLIFGTFIITFIIIPFITSCIRYLDPPPKTKITDYYQPKKIDNKTSRGPYKHVED